MLFLLFKLYVVKVVWIFIFVVICVSILLLVVYNAEMDELVLEPQIRNTEKLLNDFENKTSSSRDRYRSLMVELKRDVRKTEEEVKTLRKQISDLSLRREALKNEVVKQQEDYQRMLNNFAKELENRKMMFSSRINKSRNHSRISCLSLR